MEKIIICPNVQKLNILERLNNNKVLHNIKFMTKNEFMSNYFFSYNDDAIYYLMNKYNFNVDVAKVYLNNLYVIDIDKEYNNKKLLFLRDIKKELVDNKLLIFNRLFKEYIKDKKIEVSNYYDLDKYEENALNYNFIIPKVTINNKVFEFSTIEEEVNYVCIKIAGLLKSGIDINKIYLTNVSNDYLYIIRNLFKYYKIPINIDFNDSIYGTKVVQDFLITRKLDLEDSNKGPINKKIINILEELSNIDENDPIYNKILIDKLKHTYISPKIVSNAVNIKDLYQYEFKEDEYVFLVGFNQDVLPSFRKDIDYITDSMKDEIDMYTTDYLNRREKDIVSYLLSRINHLYLSYKLNTPFNTFYMSSLINELNLDIEHISNDNWSFSNIYNRIRLGEMLDYYYLYGKKDKNLTVLNTHYDIMYREYDNGFDGINSDVYLKNLPYPLKLSYTSINSYNECHFKYYINYVLKLNIYEDSFAAYIGSLYHKVLSLCLNKGFDFNAEYMKYISEKELSLKEKILLVRIRKDLEELINIIHSQQLLTGYDEFYFEKKFAIPINSNVSVEFIGYIDKIMYYKNMEDTYYSIIDYKTGSIDTNIEPIKYGLHMQLPAYLYLINYSKEISNPIFTGIYYQNILHDYPTWSKSLEKDLKDRYLLKGYSTDKTDILERFDSTYQESELIKSMKYSPDKGFSSYTKLINDSTLYDLVKYTKNIIEESAKDIVAAKFDINPKVYGNENISCKYCQFKDLCFMKPDNIKYLDRVDNLDFLGGVE